MLLNKQIQVFHLDVRYCLLNGLVGANITYEVNDWCHPAADICPTQAAAGRTCPGQTSLDCDGKITKGVNYR